MTLRWKVQHQGKLWHCHEKYCAASTYAIFYNSSCTAIPYATQEASNHNFNFPSDVRQPRIVCLAFWTDPIRDQHTKQDIKLKFRKWSFWFTPCRESVNLVMAFLCKWKRISISNTIHLDEILPWWHLNDSTIPVSRTQCDRHIGLLID